MKRLKISCSLHRWFVVWIFFVVMQTGAFFGMGIFDGLAVIQEKDLIDDPWYKNDCFKEMQVLIEALKKDQSDVVLFALGCFGGIISQQLPYYFVQLCKANENKKFKIYQIDPNFFENGKKDRQVNNNFAQYKEKFQLSFTTNDDHLYSCNEQKNLTIILIGTMFPAAGNNPFYQYLDRFISHKLNNKKVAFFGLHFEAYALEIPVGLAKIYIDYNKKFPENLLLYSHGGNSTTWSIFNPPGIHKNMIKQPIVIDVQSLSKIDDIVFVPIIEEQADIWLVRDKFTCDFDATNMVITNIVGETVPAYDSTQWVEFRKKRRQEYEELLPKDIKNVLEGDKMLRVDLFKQALSSVVHGG